MSDLYDALFDEDDRTRAVRQTTKRARAIERQNSLDEFDFLDKAKLPDPVATSANVARSAPQGRSFGQALGDTLKDTGLGLTQGLIRVPETGSNLISAVTGLPNEFGRQAALAREILESNKSAALRAQGQQIQQQIDAAPGELAKVGAAVKGYLTNPAALSDQVMQALPQTFVAGGAGQAVQRGAAAAGLGQAAAARAGVAGAVGSGAVMQGTDVATEAYEKLKQLDPRLWEANVEFQNRVKAGGRPSEVQDQMARELALRAGGAAGAISLFTQMIPGGRTIERALVGNLPAKAGLAGTVGRVAVGTGGEAFAEGSEEGGGKLAGNVAVASVDPNQSITEGVGQAIGTGAVVGGTMGGIAGIPSRPAPATSVQPGTPQETPQDTPQAAPQAAPETPPAPGAPSVERDLRLAEGLRSARPVLPDGTPVDEAVNNAASNMEQTPEQTNVDPVDTSPAGETAQPAAADVTADAMADVQPTQELPDPASYDGIENIAPDEQARRLDDIQLGIKQKLGIEDEAPLNIRVATEQDTDPDRWDLATRVSNTLKKLGDIDVVLSKTDGPVDEQGRRLLTTADGKEIGPAPLGIYAKGRRTVVLDIDSPRLLDTAIHEPIHFIEENYPDLYKGLAEVVAKYAAPSAKARASADIGVGPGAELDSEFVAMSLAEAGENPALWGELFRRAGEMGQAGTLKDAVFRVLDALMRAVQGDFRYINEYRQLRAYRRAINDAFTQMQVRTAQARVDARQSAGKSATAAPVNAPQTAQEAAGGPAGNSASPTPTQPPAEAPAASGEAVPTDTAEEQPTDPEGLYAFVRDRVIDGATRPSTTGIQKAHKIGYGNALKIINRLQAEGVVSPPGEKGVRTVNPVDRPKAPVTTPVPSSAPASVAASNVAEQPRTSPDNRPATPGTDKSVAAPQQTVDESIPEPTYDEEVNDEPGLQYARARKTDEFKQPESIDPVAIVRDQKSPVDIPLTVDHIAKMFDRQIADTFGGPLNPEDEAAYNRAVVQATNEVQYQLTRAKSGLDWYEEDVRLAFERTAEVFPTLMNERHQMLFSLIAAIQSPSTTARDNWVIAAEAYGHFVATGTIPGVNPANGNLWMGGPVSRNKKKQLEFLDALVKEKGIDGAVEWVSSEQTVAELNAARIRLGGFGPGGVSGKATDKRLGWYAFGEKVGPFVMNLNGLHELTIDRWAIRTFNRYFGTSTDAEGKMRDAPVNEEQRGIAKQLFTEVAGNVGIKPYQVQSVLWFFEQNLHNALGTNAKSYGFSDGADAFLQERGGAVGGGVQRGAAPATQGQPAGTQGPGGVQLSRPVAGQPGDGGGRDQGGSLAPLPGAPNVVGATGPDPRLVEVAEQYARENGITLLRQAEYVQVDPERAARIAAAYEAMPHAPQDPKVREAYRDLIRQTLAQYKALEKAGYRFFLVDETNDPYGGNPWNAMRDLRANQTMGVFATEAGFGSGATDLNVDDNPLLMYTGLRWPYGSPDGQLKRVLANDLFRAVHDAFGHGLEGAGFRAQGEENAWQAHVRLFTGPAVGAITSETRGQNSWLNYGPFGERNRNAKVEDTVFADQKTGLMPEWTWSEGRAPDQAPEVQFSRAVWDNPRFRAWFGDSKIVNADGTPKVMYHGTARDITAFRPQQAAAIFVTDEPAFADVFSQMSRDWMLKNPGQWLAPEQSRQAERDARRQMLENGYSRTDIQLLIDEGGFTKTDEYKDAIERFMPSTSNILPLYVKAENPFDYENEAHLDQIAETFQRVLAERDEGGSLPRNAIRNGIWTVIESADVQRAIRDAGFDGFYITEGGFKNLAVYRPTQLKSAIGNNGQYDPSVPDIQLARPVRYQGNRFTIAERTRREKLSNALLNEMSRVRDVQGQIAQQGGAFSRDLDVDNENRRQTRLAGNRIERFRDEKVDPLLKRVTKIGVELEDVGLLLYAKFAPQRNKYIAGINSRFSDGGSGMKDAEAKQAIAALQQKYGPVKFAQMQALAKDFQALTKETQKVLLQSGLVDPQVIQAWNAGSPDYVPLKGFDKVDDDAKETGNADPRWDFSRRALGRASRAGQIIENILKDHERAITMASINETRKTLLDFVQQNPDDKLWEVDRVVITQQFRKSLPQSPLGYAQGMVQHIRQVNKDKENTVAVRVGGNLAYITIQDRAMVDDLNRLSQTIPPGAMKAVLDHFAKVNKYLGFVYTAMSPAFVVTNAVRDLAYGTIRTTRNYGLVAGARIPLRAAAAVPSIYKSLITGNWDKSKGWDYEKWFNEFREVGGAMGIVSQLSVDHQAERLESAIARYQGAVANDPKTWARPARNLMYWIKEFILGMNTGIEQAIRVAAYAEARESKKSQKEAADIAANITVDFARRGKVAPVLSSLYLFYNPAVQGAANTIDLITNGKGWKGAAMGAASVVAPLAALGWYVAAMSSMAMGDDDEPLWNSPAYDQLKLRNLVFIKADGSRATVPLPYGVGAFVNLGYAMHDVANGRPVKDAARLMMNSVATHFSPFGSPSNPATFLAPTILDPVLVMTTDMREDGAPLLPPDYSGNTPDSERFYMRSRGTMIESFTRWINEQTGGNESRAGAISISPERINYAINFLTGGAGTFFKDTIQSLDITWNQDFGTALDKGAVPFAKAFYRGADVRPYSQSFYENKKEVERAIKEAKEQIDSGDPATQERLWKNSGIASLGGALNSTKKMLSALRKEEIAIIDSDMTDREKEQARKAIDEQRKALFADFNRMYKSMVPDEAD